MSAQDDATTSKRGDEVLCYHHYSFTFEPQLIISKFADVRVVLLAGCERRAQAQAEYLEQNLTIDTHSNHATKLERLTTDGSRFVLFKYGPVLVGNHGMGCASMSIAIHEVMLMCRSANVLGAITLIRFGTCGGVGVEPGTLCVTNRALDPLMRDFVELKICLKLVRRPCVIDSETASLLERLAKEERDEQRLGQYEVASGATVATNDFYEEQARLNGAICEHSSADRDQFLDRCLREGVINIEMESNLLAAMCHKLGVKFGIVCVALSNRLRRDAIHLDAAIVRKFTQRLFWLNLVYIKHVMKL